MKRLLAALALLIVSITLFLPPAAAEATSCPLTYYFLTLPATDIHNTTATFNGKLCLTFFGTTQKDIAQGLISPFVFRYGTAPGSYIHTVVAVPMSQEILSDRICIIAMASVTGLEPCQRYYVRFQLAPELIPLITCPIVINGAETSFTTTGCLIQPLGSGGSIPGTGASLGLSSVPVSAPVQMASVVVQSAVVATAKVSPGQNVDIAASVTNKGTANGDAKLTLYVNGEAVESKGVIVASGQTAPVHFYVSRNEPGTYSVSVNGVPAGSFTVDMFTGNDNLIYGIMALLLIGIAGTAYLLMRKKAI